MATNLLIQPDPAIERRRRLAEALAGGPKFQNVQHWTQGASNIAGPMLGAWLGRSADQEDAQRRQQAMEKISQAMSQAMSQTREGGGLGDRYSALAQALSDINPELGINMQMQQMQQQQDAEQAKKLAQFKAGLKGGGGQFQGTGVEQQMLNIVLDDSIPESDPRKELARQRLRREITTVTPEGTYVQPGYDLSAISSQATGQAQPHRQAAQPTGTQATPAAQLPGSGRLVEKPATEGERTSATYYGRMVGAQEEIDRLFSESAKFNPGSLVERGLAISNLTATPEYQQYRQAADDWIRAKLRKESGAAIPPDEMEQEYRVYFPMPGDSEAVIEQKRRARQRAERAMRTSAGRAVSAESEAGSADSGGNVVNWSDL